MNVLDYLKEKRRDLPTLVNLDMDALFWKRPGLLTKSHSNAQFNKPKVAVDRRVARAIELESAFASLLNKEIIEGEWFFLTQAHIDDFARLSGDTQWIHTDPARCERESPYRATIAHGLLLLSMLPELAGISDIAERYYHDAKFVINCGLDRVTFLNPARSSTNICAKTVLVSCQRQGRRVDITYRLIARNDEFRRNTLCEVDAVLKVYF